MKYSIVIPSYNRAFLLADTLESLNRLNTSPRLFEVVIVDDGSTDSTDEVVHSYQKKAKHSVVFVKQPNGGPSSARNAGIQRARGEYVALTDSDCVVAPDWLDQLIASFTDIKIAGVGGSTKSLRQDVFSRYFDHWGTYNTRSFPNSSEINYLLTCNACYRKQAVEEVGLFNTCFTVPGGEDPELCIRLRQKGYRLVHNPQAIIFHNHKSSASDFVNTFFNYGVGKARIETLHGIWGDKRSLEEACELSAVADTEGALSTQVASKDEASVFAVLKYAQDLALYLGYRHAREGTTTAAGVTNIYIFFRAGQEKALDLLLAQLLAAQEGCDNSYTIWFAGPASLYEPTSTLKVFMSAKKAHLRFGVPNMEVPHEFKVDDPNQAQHPGNHSPQPKDLKLRFFHFNSMIYEAIASADPFLLLYPESIISGDGWLKRLNEDYIASGKPALFSPTCTGLIGGKRVANRFAGYGIYDTAALRQFLTLNDFKQRSDNPWWPLREEGRADNNNNCFWGPVFSAYDVTFNYLAFAQLLKTAHPDATSNKVPSQWPKCDHEPTAIACYSEPHFSGLDPKTLEHATAVLVGDAPLPSLHRNLKRLHTKGRKPLFSYPLSGPSGAIDPDNDTAFTLDELRERFAGHRCFIIGNGPSLKKTDMRLLRNEFTIGFNRIYLNYENMGFEPTFFCSINKLVLQQYSEDIDRLKSIKFLSSVEEQAFLSRWNTFFMSPLNYRAAGFVTDLRPQEWYEGWTVTYTGMQLAYFLGFSEIVLIGVDHFFGDTGDANKIGVMNQPDTNHFHPDYFAKGVTWQYPDLARSEESYMRAKKYFDEKHVSVVDATVDGHLQVFQKVRYNTLFSPQATSLPRKEGIANEPLSVTRRTEVNETPLVSVLINNYNYGEFLHRCVDSCIKQSYPHIEIIIVDDGSTDQSRELLRSYETNARIRIRCQSNQGQASAFNSGFTLAQGDITCFLDSDDYWLPQKVETVVKCFRDNNNIVLAQHNNYVNREGIEDKTTVWPNVKVSGDIVDKYFTSGHTGFFSSTSGLAMPKRVLDKIFPLDESWTICADIPLTRLLPFYGDVFTISEPLGFYTIHSRNNWMNQAGQKQVLLNNVKHICLVNRHLSSFGIRKRIDFAISDIFKRLQPTVQGLSHRDLQELVAAKDYEIATEVARLLHAHTGDPGYLTAMQECKSLVASSARRSSYNLSANGMSGLVSNDIKLGPFGRESRAHIDETKVVGSLFEGECKGVMIDVGVMNGCSSLPFLDKGWQIWGFEPDDANRSNLMQALSSHPKRQLFTLDTRCVSDHSQQGLAFYRSAESTGISGLSAFRTSHAEAQRVDSVSLSDYFEGQEMPEVDFLKIDTEGHDLFVLQGFPWDRNKPRVIECEFEDLKTKPLGYTTKDMADFLIGKGYTVYVSEWHPILRYGQRHDWHRLQKYPCELACEEAWGNLLAFSKAPDETQLASAIKGQLKFHGSATPGLTKTSPAGLPCFSTPAFHHTDQFSKQGPREWRLQHDSQARQQLIVAHFAGHSTLDTSFLGLITLESDQQASVTLSIGRTGNKPYEGSQTVLNLTPGLKRTATLLHKFTAEHGGVKIQVDVKKCAAKEAIIRIEACALLNNGNEMLSMQNTNKPTLADANQLFREQKYAECIPLYLAASRRMGSKALELNAQLALRRLGVKDKVISTKILSELA